MTRARKHARRPEAAPAGPAAPEEAAASVFPPFADWMRPSQPYLIPAILLLISRALAWWSLPLAAEDAYITFRFSRNLASGNGLLYNPGERVMGFSSPLWALWNALGIRLMNDPVTW